jgi:diadenylate cyclase
VGISEVSDSLTIVVSEETGRVSIAMNGDLYRNIDADFLRNKLVYIQRREKKTSKIESWRRRLKNVKEARANADK